MRGNSFGEHTLRNLHQQIRTDERKGQRHKHNRAFVSTAIRTRFFHYMAEPSVPSTSDILFRWQRLTGGDAIGNFDALRLHNSGTTVRFSK